jgi:hypothetical protein
MKFKVGNAVEEITTYRKKWRGHGWKLDEKAAIINLHREKKETSKEES